MISKKAKASEIIPRGKQMDWADEKAKKIIEEYSDCVDAYDKEGVMNLAVPSADEFIAEALRDARNQGIEEAAKLINKGQYGASRQNAAAIRALKDKSG